MDFFVHPSAIIDEGAVIGAGTKVWHFCHVMNGASIGKNCTLGQNVFVAGTVKLGDNVKVQNNVSLYDGVICENDVFIGPSAVFTNVINPRSEVARKMEYRPTVVRTGATIGANATIICGNEIGTYAFVGAGAVVTKPVLPYAVFKGNPARQAGWMSEKGGKLLFDKDGRAVCPFDRAEYSLKNGEVNKLTPSKSK
jgi:UDP-2-acetamido-3-amino-2,3-dideoxy-glucuronate N-acetyltransferase